MDIQYSFPPTLKRWLVCIYGGNDLSMTDAQFVGGNIEWWEEQDRGYTNCILRIRETQNPGSRSDWSAVATCR